jgi:hypothetical protein
VIDKPVASFGPVLVIVMLRAFPVKAAFSGELLTESPNVEGVILKMAVSGEVRRVMTKVSPKLGW